MPSNRRLPSPPGRTGSLARGSYNSRKRSLRRSRCEHGGVGFGPVAPSFLLVMLCVLKYPLRANIQVWYVERLRHFFSYKNYASVRGAAHCTEEFSVFIGANLQGTRKPRKGRSGVLPKYKETPLYNAVAGKAYPSVQV